MNGLALYAFVGTILVSAESQSYANQELHRIVLTGEPIPGAADKTYQYSNSAPTINNLGQVAFHTYFDSPNYEYTPAEGIWTNSRNPNGEMIISAGDHVPGTAPGSVFRSFGISNLNDLGQIGSRDNRHARIRRWRLAIRQWTSNSDCRTRPTSAGI